MRIFIVAAVVLTVFMIIAAAAASGTLFTVGWPVWLGAALLSFFVDLLFPWTLAQGGFARRTPPPQV